ncbi:glycosyltransferase involved in cell wall biosynthesis [Thermosporothrix hazakensis]|uniref:Glycosyltransferase involved in cell wall biosynthesis n=2 Tax=Thermosporothrix TaxID=768650 RepID=A0A326U3X1_THEHA|nr:glycosyltransferase involved in cell wall biosynthesis [Thermosporothrix hazakensis]
MRVLMISKALIAGTSQRKLEELAKCPDVELTLATPPYWKADDGSKQVLEKLYLSGYRMIVTPMALNGHFHIHFYPKLGEIFREVQPDIVHIDEEPYNLATYQAMRLSRKYRARALFFAYQNLYRAYPQPFRYFEQYNYTHTTTAIAGNQDAADVLRRKGYRKSVHVIPQFGFDTDIFKRTVPLQPPAPERPFVIGYVGRLVEQKGISTLVDALALLPERCRVVLIGFGPMKEVLTEQARRLGVSDRLTFKASVPTREIPAELQKLDVLVLPSLTRPNWAEQFGRVLAEAMSCEVPVVGSDSAEIPYVIGDAGLIFPEGNAQELANRLRQLLDNPDLYLELARKGRQRVLTHYTQEQIARQTYQVYCEMLEKPV